MARRILGIAGPPGAGKSTYAARLVAESTVAAAYLPMDGFHLADAALGGWACWTARARPRPSTRWGYAALLRRVRTARETVWAPGFERDLEQPLAGAIAIDPEVELVVTEGNYLLLDRPEWRAVRAELDEVWFLDVPDEVRRPRLLARHTAYGKTLAEAQAWVARVDDANAALVAATRAAADRVIEDRDTAAGCGVV